MSAKNVEQKPIAYSLYLVDIVRPVHVKDTACLVVSHEKGKAPSLEQLKEAVEREDYNIVEDTNEVISMGSVERVENPEVVSPRMSRMLSKAIRASNKRLNEIKEKNKK